VHSPLGRNVGQVTGVFAENSFDAAGVKSTANLPNLHKLENLIKSLRAPAWPESVFGAIDRDLAARGAGIYAEKCTGCHDPSPARSAPNAFGKTFARVDFSTPLSVLGTDRSAAEKFATRRADPGPFRAIAQAQGLIGPDDKAPVAALLAISGTMIIQRFFATPPALTDLEKADYLDFREPRTATTAQLLTYKARKLNGIAFTAPYLHNGSVQSLYELLLPPAQRAKQFYVGSKELDPQHLGFESCAEQGVLLDTTAAGNGNGGHVWGTELADDQRFALLEYLKTL
jgi:hypothetical protein